MLTEEEKHIALLKPYDLMTNKEFEFVMFFERWASTQKYETIQLIHLTQALEIFEDELFDICIDHISANIEKEKFQKLLDRLKNFRYSDQLNVEEAKKYPIEKLVREFGLDIRQNKIRSFNHKDERTPSLHIYKDTNSYYDFSSNKGGDVIDFLMNYKNITFVEAVKWLS